MTKNIFRLIITILSFGILILSFLETSTDPSLIKLTIYSTLMFLTGLFLIIQIKNKKLLNFLVRAEFRENRMESFHLLSSPIIFIGLFIIISKNLYLLNPDLFIINKDITSLNWIRFGIDQTIRAIGLDLLETFNIHLSMIKPNDLSVMGFIFIYKTFLTFTFWSLIIKMINSIKR